MPPLWILLICLFPLSISEISKVSDEEAALIKKECTPSPVSKRSIDGRIAENHQFKHTVRVEIKEKKGSQFSACTGVLISSKHVISAAHCFFRLDWESKNNTCLRGKRYDLDQKLINEKKPLVSSSFVDSDMYSITVQYGARCVMLLEGYGDCDAAQVNKNITVKKVVIHPMYLYDFCYSGDIAILELEDSIEFSNEHQTELRANETTVADYGCLPTNDIEVQSELLLGGFGIDPKNDTGLNEEKWLKYINVTVADSCLGFVSKRTDQPLDGFCSRATVGVTCKGDSAGPLIQPLDGRGKKDVLIAVHSEAMSCEISKNFLETNKDEELKIRLSKHTDLRVHLRWICGVTGICTEDYGEDNLFEKPVELF